VHIRKQAKFATFLAAMNGCALTGMETHEVTVKFHLANELRCLTIVDKNIPIFRYDTEPSGHDNNSTELHKIGQ
jgi:hypothetical protein